MPDRNETRYPSELIANLKLGHKAMAYAGSFIEESPSFIDFLSLGNSNALWKRIEKMQRSTFSKSKILHLIFGNFYLYQDITLLFKYKRNAVKQFAHETNEKVGNCDEYASFAYSYCQRYAKNIHIEYVELGDNLHFFVVIGRDPNSDINDPDSWGDQAVIVDAWHNRTYPATKENIENYLFTVDGVRQYDPDVNKLRVLYSNQGPQLAFSEQHKIALEQVCFLIEFCNQLEEQNSAVKTVSADLRLLLEEINSVQPSDIPTKTSTWSKQIKNQVDAICQLNPALADKLVTHWLNSYINDLEQFVNKKEFLTDILLRTLPEDLAFTLLQKLLNSPALEKSGLHLKFFLEHYIKNSYDSCVSLLLATKKDVIKKHISEDMVYHLIKHQKWNLLTMMDDEILLDYLSPKKLNKIKSEVSELEGNGHSTLPIKKRKIS